MNLLNITGRGISSCHSAWVDAEPDEEGAPEKRIIHLRSIQLREDVILKRAGVRLGQGYAKCGSQREIDWPQNIVVLTRDQNDVEWKVIFKTGIV